VKKLVFLIALIPIVSFGQVTLDKILDIKTEQDFKRTFIEAGFQQETVLENDDRIVSYTKKIVNQSISAIFRRSDSLSAKAVAVMFEPDMFDKNVIYDGIYDKVKEECIFFEVRNSIGMDVAFYNCPNPNPDPRLVALDKKLRKEIPDRPNPDLNISDLQIGFVKNNGLFVIQYPIFDVFVDELVKVSNEMIKMMKEMKKEESNQ
tara:strand:+ start:97 stop:711 length:615 start_codon:yes stop_codon:yes gene_type:complete